MQQSSEKPPGISAPATDLIAWNLRKWRTAAGLSQDGLSTKADVDRTYVSRLERGIENPSVLVLEKLAAACAIHVSQLLTVPEANEKRPRAMAAGRKPKAVKASEGHSS
ncbi:helix-turn-helix transcriptional regulator [Devosia sp. BK]|uniref:helix-turn-helix domain-containing protein n=1 Tax=Devosia sp. BK TaxID=2871706 RepID=UPI00293B9A4E|nr:helix-turn-helix transcriptional regulator [Devosia sp. BK]